MNTGGSYNYKWTLEKTVNGQATGSAPLIRVQKGVKQEIPYQLKYTRTVDQTNAALTVSGSLQIASATPITITAVSVTITSTQGQGTPTTISIGGQLACTQMAATTSSSCSFTNVPYTGFLTAGQATATITWNDGTPGGASTTTDVPASPAFGFTQVTGNYATALLTDKVDLSPLDQLYSGFTGFTRSSVWRYLDSATQIPDAGLPVQDSDTKT